MIPAVLLAFAPFAYDQYTLPRLALAALLVAWFGVREGFCFRKPLTAPLLAAFMALCVSAGLSGDPLVNLTGRYMARYLGLIPLGVCLLAYHLRPRPIVAQAQVAAGLCAAYALSQLLWTPLGYAVVVTGGRVVGSMGSPPALGCALAMLLPFTLARPWLAVLTMAGLLASGSRGPLLASGIAVAAYAAMHGYGRRWMLLGLIPVALVPFLNHGTSDQIRLLTWTSAMDVWLTAPWFGVGAESYVDAWRAFRSPEWIALVGTQTYQDHAHNDLLMALASAGVAGLLAYCYLLWRVTRRVTDTLWYLPDAPIACSLLAVFICAKFNAVPFGVLFCLALILGSMDSGECSINERYWLREASCVLALVTTLMFAADVAFYRARKVLDFAGIHRAASWNPTELFYQAHMADLLTRKWMHTREPELLERALWTADDALYAHPNSVQAHHIRTQTLLFLAQSNPAYLRDAARAAEDLIKRDPGLDLRFRVVVK